MPKFLLVRVRQCERIVSTPFVADLAGISKLHMVSNFKFFCQAQSIACTSSLMLQVVDWYTNEWDETQKNEFLIKLLLKLDERQHFFISNLLSVKQYKDFITLLPVHVSLRILSYLTPKQLVKASRVS